ncbi:D-alanyl-D-alanine carboxypeptidase [Dehalobacter sp. DCM]|uniref:D-alanyl-D-alanine carboxypeptidase family protein n=1 Tax=Dehalobacter sp. DCM TaxID=2907827 RepID=UPI00308177BE|nr:D-alanyl-D-alanine carboxypeptidase [Dehalobacter sp. DCM]
MPKYFWRLLTTLVITVSFLAGNALPAKAANIQTTAESAILMDAGTGKILYEKNAHKELAPASVTKLMTLLVAAEAVECGKVKLTDKVTASEQASSLGGSQIYLEPGETFSLKEMMISIAVGSANDACVAVAEHIYGTHEEFVDRMNQKAKDLGLKNTHFVNAYGLPADAHYTSAYDLALIGMEALKHPLVTELTAMKEYNLRNGEFKLWNTNKLLWWYEGADGFKTGWTQEAKYCLASTVKRDGLRLICVVMGIPEVRGHFHESIKIYNYGFANYTYKEFAAAGTKQGEITVNKGNTSTVELISDRAIGLCIEKGKENACRIETHYFKNTESAPIHKGQQLGEVILYCGEKEEGRIKLVAKEEVKRAGLLDMVKRTVVTSYGMAPNYAN